ncbi:GD22757 [Drosophila simulans]|uniref:GD22757 n=1 Tax=Drosophila simulans TaxID=7240 RepID=B4NV25_DROSI|nr:GD22757 [Drosophila simulans]
MEVLLRTEIKNPGDIVSRGCDVDEIRQSIWLNAHFYLDDEVYRQAASKSTVGLTTAVQTSDMLDVIEEFSSHLKLLRVYAYMFRIISNSYSD